MELFLPVTGNIGFPVRNTKNFAELVRKHFLAAKDVFLSFDEVSLLTNGPKTPALEVAGAQLKEGCSSESRTTLTMNDILPMLRFCLHSTYFAFLTKFTTK